MVYLPQVLGYILPLVEILNDITEPTSAARSHRIYIIRGGLGGQRQESTPGCVHWRIS